VYNIAGGYPIPRETAEETAVREGRDEVAIDFVNPRQLSGNGGTANRLYFAVNVSAGEGVQSFEMEIPTTEFESCSAGRIRGTGRSESRTVLPSEVAK